MKTPTHPPTQVENGDIMPTQQLDPRLDWNLKLIMGFAKNSPRPPINEEKVHRLITHLNHSPY